MLHCLDLYLFMSGANIFSSSLCATSLMETVFQQISSIYMSICQRETIHLYFTDPVLVPTTSIFHMNGREPEWAIPTKGVGNELKCIKMH